jgi:hypothetical protein
VDDKPQKQVDPDTVTKLLADSRIVRLVTVLDIASLSILELLEYDLTRKDVNHALASEIIEIDKATLPHAQIDTSSERGLLVSGDVYFYQFLNSKIHLSDLGRYILARIKEGKETTHRKTEISLERENTEREYK